MGYKMTLRETLEAGQYPAHVTAIEMEAGQYGEQFRWTFTLMGSDERELGAWSSATFSPSSKFCAWATVLLGHTPKNLDTDELLNKPCVLDVTKHVSDKGAEYNKVRALLPAQEGMQPRPPKDIPF